MSVRGSGNQSPRGQRDNYIAYCAVGDSGHPEGVHQGTPKASQPEGHRLELSIGGGDKWLEEEAISELSSSAAIEASVQKPEALPFSTHRTQPSLDMPGPHSGGEQA